MSARYFCDGCDQEVGETRKQLSIAIFDSPPPAVASTSRKYDLCEGCAKKLYVNLDPKRWERAS